MSQADGDRGRGAPLPNGDDLYRHAEDDRTARPPARADEAVRAANARHLESHLGDDFMVAAERISDGVALSRNLYPSGPQRDFATVVTVGMSDVPQRTPSGHELRTELLIGVPAGWPGLDPWDPERLRDERAFWPMRLVAELGHLPTAYDTFLTWGHTVELRGTFPPDTPFVAALIGPPAPFEPSILTSETPAGDVSYFGVIPITESELEFARSAPNGSEELIERLLDAGVTAVVDPARPSVV